MTRDGEPSRPRTRRWRWLFLALVVIAVGYLLFRLTAGPKVPPNTVLTIDLRQEIVERSTGGLLELVGPPALNMDSLRRLLVAAAEDERISGLLLRTSRSPCGSGRVQDLRSLVAEFRASGKPVLAYAEGADSLGYLLAASADQVLLDETSSVDLTGIAVSAFFLKDVLKRWGVEMDLVRVGEFKGAFEQLTADEPSRQFSEALESLVDSLYETLVSEIAWSRRLEESRVRELIDLAPLSPQKALETKLVDEVLRRSQLNEKLKSQFGRDVSPIRAETYLDSLGSQPHVTHRVALVHVVGLIVEGETRYMPLLGGATGAETVVRALRQAQEDPEIRAVLLRVDSQGGEASAAAKIWAQVENTAQSKPVVASLGDVAASGGYYVACAANAVVAQPSTLTGSIGVFGGKAVVEQLLADQQIRVERRARGKHAGLHDPTRRYSLDERRVLEERLDEVYRDFVRRVADGRRIQYAEADRAARGRIWTGRQAKERKLVDELGGLSVALGKLKKLAGISTDSDIEIVELPERPTVWDLLLDAEGQEVLRAADSRRRDRILEQITKSLLSGDPLLDGRSVLALSPFWLRVR